jgi:hypothetical protein
LRFQLVEVFGNEIFLLKKYLEANTEVYEITRAFLLSLIEDTLGRQKENDLSSKRYS